MGERTVTVRAEININGYSFFSPQTKDVSSGKEPLSVSAGAPKGSMNWKDAVSACGGTGELSTDGYQRSTNLPSMEQLKTVAGGTGNSA